MRRPGIHFRLMIAAGVMIAVVTLALDVVGVKIISNFMHKRFHDRILFLAKYLSRNSEVGVLISDRSGLKSLALNLLGEEDVAKVMIIDNTEEVLVDISRPIVGPLASVESPIMLKRSADELILYDHVMTPLGKHQVTRKDYLGKVKIEFSTAGIKQLLQEMTRTFIVISTGLTILAVTIFYFLSRSIVVDVLQLAKTARKIAGGDAELRASPGKLPETRELASAFNGMLDSLEESRRAIDRINEEVSRHKAMAERGKFSLIVAHEVKNPLSIIKSSLDVLKKELQLPTDHLMVVYIEDEIKRLNQLIEDFLMFARPIKPKMKKVDLNKLIMDVAARFDVQKMNLPIQFDTITSDDVCDVFADRDLLIRSFSNIIKNACEANNEAGKVFIRTCVNGSFGIVEIEDQGPGVLAEDAQKLFEPFFTKSAKGTGLGLAFVQQVISIHQGSVGVMNTASGALFRVALPLFYEVPDKT